MRTVFAKALHDQRRSLLGWGLGLSLVVLLETALWPSIGKMTNLQQFLADYPEAMRKLFNLQDFGTGTGFVNGELFSALVPVLFLTYAIGRGARAIAGEEEAGTLDVLLVTPVTTTGLLLQQSAALLTGLLALGTVLYAAVLAGSVLFGLGIGLGPLLSATLAMVLLAFEFGALALAAGAVTGRRGLAIAVAGAAAVAGYLLYVAGELVGAVEPWQPLSPFDQAMSGGPIGAGFRWTYLVMPAVAMLLVGAAAPRFARRDIAVAH
ncbi:ABC transporter permease subunit [Actinoplanes sp. NPDC020271]|uniref:ABC transporter permease subunit n=1 Tax=Actinoplanes sp. NPDC020271 TaxID=3363896 RepID=UPI00379A794F